MKRLSRIVFLGASLAAVVVLYALVPRMPQHPWLDALLFIAVPMAIGGAILIVFTRPDREPGELVGRRKYRRSAGSATFSDVLVTLWHGRTDSAADIRFVEDGGVLFMEIYRDVGPRIRRRKFAIGLNEDQRVAVSDLLGAAPYRVERVVVPERRFVDASQFRQIDGVSARGAWSISVPTIDVPLVRHVLAALSKSVAAGE